MKGWLICLVFLGLRLLDPRCHAAASPTGQNVPSPSSELGSAEEELSSSTPRLPWQGLGFWSAAYTINAPQAVARDHFKTGEAHPMLSYRYFLSQEWVMGLSAQFKMLGLRSESTSSLAIASLSQETSYMLRLYHPLYLLTGLRLHYLLPTEKGMLPLTRHTTYPNEVGIGLSLGAHYFWHPKRYVQVHLERWRGTKTQLLQGLELAVSVGFSL